MLLEDEAIAGRFVGKIALYETEDGKWIAEYKLAEDAESTFMEVPPHMAMQIPTAIKMMKMQALA